MFEFAAAVIACLVGAGLSVRFNFFVLVPVLLVVLVLVALGEVARGETIWLTGATIFLAAIYAQVGYFAGSVLRFMDENPRGDLRIRPSTTRDQGGRQPAATRRPSALAND
jgi:hypothetical protein